MGFLGERVGWARGCGSEQAMTQYGDLKVLLVGVTCGIGGYVDRHC